MIILVEFLEEFDTVPRFTKTSVDIDWAETIENLKVLITLKYTDLDPNAFDVYYRGKKLRPSAKVNSIDYQEGTYLSVRKTKSEFCVCI